MYVSLRWNSQIVPRWRGVREAADSIGHWPIYSGERFSTEELVPGVGDGVASEHVLGGVLLGLGPTSLLLEVLVKLASLAVVVARQGAEGEAAGLGGRVGAGRVRLGGHVCCVGRRPWVRWGLVESVC